MSLYEILKIRNHHDLISVSKIINIRTSLLKYYNDENIVPTGKEKKRILRYTGLSEIEFNILMGDINIEILNSLQKNYKQIASVLETKERAAEKSLNLSDFLKFKTNYGSLYQGDSLKLLKGVKNESIDLVFADPPFDLGKQYESGINDSKEKIDYLKWTEKWLDEAIRVLKPGGAIFIWNIPKWNSYISNILNRKLRFLNWIAVDMKYGMPIPNRFYPSHYSLLYYVKGPKPKTFNKERIPLEVCKNCGMELKDYGGYKSKLNPKGITLSDVWHDIYPVRHIRYKNRKSNELPLKLLDRVISISTNSGDVVLDPFGGSGTTYVVAELLKRKWIGFEIGSVDTIINRMENLSVERKQLEKIQSEKNKLFLPNIEKKRIENGYWLPSDFERNKN